MISTVQDKIRQLKKSNGLIPEEQPKVIERDKKNVKKYVISKEKKKVYNDRYNEKKHLNEVICYCPYCYRRQKNAPIKRNNINHVKSKLHQQNKIEFEMYKDKIMTQELQELINRFSEFFPDT